MGNGIVNELEAIEDFHRATVLNTNDAAEHAGRSCIPDLVIGGVLRLGFDAGVVVGDVDDHEGMKLEGQTAPRRQRCHRGDSPLLRRRCASCFTFTVGGGGVSGSRALHDNSEPLSFFVFFFVFTDFSQFQFSGQPFYFNLF